MKVNFTTAKINGLNEHPFYFEHHCDYAWGITFPDKPFFNLAYIYVGRTKEEAMFYYNQFKGNFDQAGIFDGDTVAILSDKKNGFVRAIGSIGQDSWIDVKDKFACKTLKELKVKIDSFKVH